MEKKYLSPSNPNIFTNHFELIHSTVYIECLYTWMCQDESVDSPKPTVTERSRHGFLCSGWAKMVMIVFVFFPQCVSFMIIKWLEEFPSSVVCAFPKSHALISISYNFLLLLYIYIYIYIYIGNIRKYCFSVVYN